MYAHVFTTFSRCGFGTNELFIGTVANSAFCYAQHEMVYMT